MDEISQDPKRCVRFPRRRWLDVALAVALITATVLAVMTGRGSRPAAAPAGQTRRGGGPGAAAIIRADTDPAAVRPARRHDHTRLHGLDLGLVR